MNDDDFRAERASAFQPCPPFIEPAFDAWDGDVGVLLGRTPAGFAPEAWADEPPED